LDLINARKMEHIKNTNPLGHIYIHPLTRYGLDGYHQGENYFVKERYSSLHTHSLSYLLVELTQQKNPRQIRYHHHLYHHHHHPYNDTSF